MSLPGLLEATDAIVMSFVQVLSQDCSLTGLCFGLNLKIKQKSENRAPFPVAKPCSSAAVMKKHQDFALRKSNL